MEFTSFQEHIEHQFDTFCITKNVTINNERQKVTVSLDKVLEMPENAANDFNPYANVQFGLYAKEDIKAVTGVVIIPAGALLELFGVNADGKAAIQTDLPVGNSFFICELSTAAGYELNKNTFDIVFDYTPEKGKAIEIAVNNGCTH